ncbi:MAG TPA: DUF1801 domain-containing protein [Vicinamibacterales bacterium]|nr:DUF1801 domain-containing protein [Vicinamibacterales bacterium]
MASKPTTVKEYLASLPNDRRAAMEQVRKVIVDNLPKGYEEGTALGMLMYSVPLSVLPNTYNGQPLCYAALASQKNYMSVHLMPLYGDKKTEAWFRSEFKARGKKLDMGKSCVRFKNVDDLPLDLIGDVIRKFPMAQWVSLYEQSRASARPARKKSGAGGTRAAKATARPRPGR